MFKNNGDSLRKSLKIGNKVQIVHGHKYYLQMLNINDVLLDIVPAILDDIGE